MINSVPYFIARISEDKDFFTLRELAENHDGWKLEYSREGVKVWTKQLDGSSFNMVKVWAVFSNVNCVDLYDTIQDPEYRKEWDSHMIVGIDIGYLNPNNDVSYYAMHCPTPLKNRDLVLQKSWLDNGSEFYIINHSVYHKDYPPKKGFVRAISYFTGYFIKCLTVNRESNGCELSYVTRSNPQGVLPSWLVNKCTQIFAPKYIKQIEKAASRYGSWKCNNNPLIKPWIYPEQIKSPRITVQDCVPGDEELELHPQLRECNFDVYYCPATVASSDVKPDISKENVENSESEINASSKTSGNGLEESGESSHGTSSKSRNRLRRSSGKSPRNRFNSFFKIAKICGKKQVEE